MASGVQLLSLLSLITLNSWASSLSQHGAFTQIKTQVHATAVFLASPSKCRPGTHMISNGKSKVSFSQSLQQKLSMSFLPHPEAAAAPSPPVYYEPKYESKMYSRLVPTARRPFTENGMRYRSDDWIVNILSIPRSYLLRRIKSHLVFDQLVCLFTLLARKFLGWKFLSVPLLGHSLLGSFLGLLLVFRTNSAYARFWDARGYWADISARCRSLALESVNYIRPLAPKSAKKFEQLLAAFPDVLAYTCLAGNKEAHLPTHIMQLLYDDFDAAEMSQISTSQTNSEDLNLDAIHHMNSTVNGENINATRIVRVDPSTAILQKLHTCLYEASVEAPKQPTVLFTLYLSSMGLELNVLSDALSGCEKIVRTPVPLSYSRHASRFSTLWCGFLPLAIIGELGWLSIPVMGTVSWLVYGIEEIGHLIEQPFVPVSLMSLPRILVKHDANDDDRSFKTHPYDIGIPVSTLAEKIRMEVENIISL